MPLLEATGMPQPEEFGIAVKMHLQNITLPSISQWFDALPTVYIVFIVLSCILTIVIFVLTLMMCYVVHYCVPNEYIQGDMYYIICVPFMVSGFCLVGNIIPRAAAVMYACGLVYLMICLQTTIQLITRLFGTRKDMAQWMMHNAKVLSFDVRPWCCCCHCLPEVQPTPRKVRYLTYLVKQSPFLRVFLQLILVVLALDGLAETGIVVQILNGIGVASTLIAVFICHVIVTATKDHLTPYNMYVIFRCVDAAQMLFTFQKFILDLIANNGGMGGISDIAKPTDVSRFWHNTAMIFELSIICVILYFNVTPQKSLLFAQSKPSQENGNNVPLTDV